MPLAGFMAPQLDERLYTFAYTQHLVLYKTNYQNTKYIIFLRALTQITHSEAEKIHIVSRNCSHHLQEVTH